MADAGVDVSVEVAPEPEPEPEPAAAATHAAGKPKRPSAADVLEKLFGSAARAEFFFVQVGGALSAVTFSHTFCFAFCSRFQPSSRLIHRLGGATHVIAHFSPAFSAHF